MRPVAAARADRRRAPQPRPRRRVGAAVRDRPALSRRRRASDARRCCSPASGAPRDWQSGKAQAFDAFDAKAEVAGAARRGGRAGRQPAGVPRCRPDLASRAGRPSSGSGRRRSSPASASFTRGCRRALDAPAGAVAAEIYLDAIPAPRSSGRARAGLCAAGAAGGHPRLRLHRPGRACRRQPAPRDPRRRQGGDHRRAAVRPVRSARRAVAGLRSDAPAGRKSFTDEQIGEISKRIVAAAEKLGARLRS